MVIHKTYTLLCPEPRMKTALWWFLSKLSFRIGMSTSRQLLSDHPWPMSKSSLIQRALSQHQWNEMAQNLVLSAVLHWLAVVISQTMLVFWWWVHSLKHLSCSHLLVRSKPFLQSVKVHRCVLHSLLKSLKKHFRRRKVLLVRATWCSIPLQYILLATFVFQKLQVSVAHLPELVYRSGPKR